MMIRKIRPLVLLLILGLILTSCSLTSADPAILAAQTATAAQLVNLELTVQTEPSISYNTAGQVIKINPAVKNTGSAGATSPITWTGATVTCPGVNTVGNLNDTLDPNETLPCTSEYSITQADIDKGSVTFLIMATVNVVNSNQAILTVPIVQSKILTLTTTANPLTYGQVGQQIVFTYVVKNSGSSNLGPDQFKISDGLIGTAPFNCGAANITIAPNETVTCTAPYTVTQADSTAVSITNVATASGGGATSQPASTTVTKTSPPANASGTTVQHIVDKGEWLWQIARCYGADPVKTVEANRQLSNPAEIKEGMTVTVPNIGSYGTAHITSSSQPCVTMHTVQSGDTWNSIAAKYGADPSFLQMVNANTMTVGTQVKVPHYTAGMYPASNLANPVSTALSLSVTPNPTSYDQAGQTITYTYVIRNSGTTTLGPAQFTVTDGLISPAAFNCGPANTTLTPNATVSCNAPSPYTITQADLNAVSITNVATASGGGAGASQSATATVNKAVKTLTMTTVANPTTYNQAGQQITFTYVIKNSGTATLGPAQFTVSDGLISPNPINCGDPNTNLAPNATVTCTAIYAVTQADLTAVSITNVATASGGGAGPSQPASTTIIKQ
jgi:uncharacterized repeat protein (TIGR01451 family)